LAGEAILFAAMIMTSMTDEKPRGVRDTIQ